MYMLAGSFFLASGLNGSSLRGKSNSLEPWYGYVAQPGQLVVVVMLKPMNTATISHLAIHYLVIHDNNVSGLSRT